MVGGHLAELAAATKRWREAAEAEPQMRLPFPQVCPWLYAQATLDRSEALKALVAKDL